MEALDLAVGLGPVGPGALGGDAEAGAGAQPKAGAVAGAVVAQDALDGDPGGGVPGVRAGQECGGGFLASRRPGSRCRPAGSGRRGRCAGSRSPGRGLAVAAWRRAGSWWAWLLRLPGPARTRQPPPSGMLPSFLTSTWTSSPGGRAHIGAPAPPGPGPGAPAAGSRSGPAPRARSRGSGPAARRSGPGPACPAPAARRSAARSAPACGAGWRAAVGPVRHPGRAQLPVPARPPGRGGGRDLEPLGSTPQRPAIVNDTPGQAQPPGLGQRGITVGHEDLPAVRC